LTFYGYPDNDPPSTAIAYPQIHSFAGGTGTYDDPVTVAIVTEMNGGNWSPSTKMYVPYLKKYLIVEDECASCVPDQIDVWMDSNHTNPNEVLQCEEAWTPEEPVEVEINPPAGREVITTPFFDISTAQCRQP
jgi:3D (Asp-Asp-Asp) domain-containing protein